MRRTTSSRCSNSTATTTAPPAFDKIITATHDHFWDPLDKAYIDFDEPFDMENQAIVPEDMVVSLSTDYVSNHLSDPKTRIRFINESTLRSFSSILHGEQGALNLSASLCHVLKDQGAQEYAANQTREEARHVTAFAKYIKARWGKPVECGPTLKALLIDIIGSPEVYKKIIGMQMLVEGLAMGAFATVFAKTNDPLAKKLMQLVHEPDAGLPVAQVIGDIVGGQRDNHVLRQEHLVLHVERLVEVDVLLVQRVPEMIVGRRDDLVEGRRAIAVPVQFQHGLKMVGRDGVVDDVLGDITVGGHGSAPHLF